MPAAPRLRTSLPALDRALAPEGSHEPLASFVNDVAPGEVEAAVRRCLPSTCGSVVLQLVRAKVKPGRKLTAEYEVVLPSAGLRRRIAVTWVGPCATAPGPSPGAEDEAHRRGVLAPFHRSWLVSDDGRMSVSVAPVDGAFPQLVRLHDPAHAMILLRASRVTAGLGDEAARVVVVETIRYRPGQRHVLRVVAGAGGPAWYAKVYRDGTGRRAIDAAAQAAAAFAAAGGGAAGVLPSAGAYVAAARVAFWPEVIGVPLAEAVTRSTAAAAEAVRATGAGLRLVHEAPVAAGSPAGPDAVAQARTTLRTAELLDALAPAVGARLRSAVGRALERLEALPAERPTVTHGDVKCDNVLVGESGVHFLDFDRAGRGDPAADVGKFLADLRWWTAGDDRATARLHDSFLRGYGRVDASRLARARAYDGLLHLRMAARRVPIQDPDWAPRVDRAVSAAAATLARESRS